MTTGMLWASLAGGLQQNLQVYENHINRRQCITEETLDILMGYAKNNLKHRLQQKRTRYSSRKQEERANRAILEAEYSI